jgi:parallel beta-helix repeat protein
MAKQLLTIVSIFLFLRAGAVNYYTSADGRDDNPGMSPELAWKTLSKVNSAKLNPGDSVFFRRGDTFYGNLKISCSGSIGNPVYYGAYGRGYNPNITGFSTVGAWTNIGTNLWESRSAISTLNLANVVSINGVSVAMGRYPNASAGYLQYQSHVANTSITSSSLNGTPSWVGAEVVLRPEKWIIARDSITAQSNGTITYTAGTGLPYKNGQAYNGRDNWGFFIQNSITACDTVNEWFYKRSTRKLDIYSVGSPTATIKVSSIDTLINLIHHDYITFDNLQFTGANSIAFYVGQSKGIQITHCKFDLNYNGVIGGNWGVRNSSSELLFNLDTVTHSSNKAFSITNEFSTANVTNNLIKSTGTMPGMGGSGDGQYQGINVAGSGTNVLYNEVDSTGYVAIGFQFSNINVSYNYVHNYCFVKDDGGGIYTQQAASGNLVSYNTVINGMGALNGTANGFTGGNGLSAAFGIYFDDLSSGGVISHNTTANNSFGGIFLHNANNIKVIDNTSYNNLKTGFILSDNKEGLTKTGGIVCERNIFFQKDSTRQANFQNSCFTINTIYNDLDSLGSFDYNYFARPIDDNLVFDIVTGSSGGKHNRYTLDSWKTLSGFERNSKKSPVTIVHTGDIRFEYNATQSPVTITLPYEYTDVTGRSFQGSFSLPPFSSLILMKK